METFGTNFIRDATSTFNGNHMLTHPNNGAFSGADVHTDIASINHTINALNSCAAQAQYMSLWSDENQPPGPSPPKTPEPEKYSRKVFVGGLPPDMSSDAISLFFSQFGNNIVDWPHRSCVRGSCPPNGYAFIVFLSSNSVRHLIDQCMMRQGKLNIMLRNCGKNVKMVQVRPWQHADQYYRMGSNPPNDRFSIFIGGVPRTTTAMELALLIQQKVGNVAYVSLEVDNETRYPKGAARVVFDNRESYVTAIAMHLVTLNTIDHEKEMEIKPFVLDNILCENCGISGPNHLCPELCCLYYLCERCWFTVHNRRGLNNHRPMIKGRMKPSNGGKSTPQNGMNQTQYSRSNRISNRHSNSHMQCNCSRGRSAMKDGVYDTSAGMGSASMGI